MGDNHVTMYDSVSSHPSVGSGWSGEKGAVNSLAGPS